MSGAAVPQVTSVAAFYSIAYQIEADAAERYAMLAEQMQTHNNPELARMFGDLARTERVHADKIRDLAGAVGIDGGGGSIGPWNSESPESADLYSASYDMSAHDAVRMALAAEERALAFYTKLAASGVDQAVRDLAAAFADEEREHVAICRRLLTRYRPVPGNRPGDPDPPGDR